MTEKLPKTFCPIKNTIVDALCSTRMSGYEWNVVMTVIRKTYGWNDGSGARKTEDYISLSQFSDSTKIKEAHVSRTLRLLIDRRILTKRGKFFGINKKTEEWMDLPKGVNTHGLTKRGLGFTKRGKKNLPKGGDTKERKETITKENNQPTAPKGGVFFVDPVLKKALQEVYDRGLNVYKMLGKFRKGLREKRVTMLGPDYRIPDQVILAACAGFKKYDDRHEIERACPWFLKVLGQELERWWVEKQDKEHQEIKSDLATSRGGDVQSVKDIIAGMMSKKEAV